MSYHSRFLGAIQIDPPLTAQEIRITPRLRDLDLKKTEHEEVTETGMIYTVTCASVASWTVGPRDGVYVIEDLQKIVDTHGQKHQFTGHISVMGEDAEDIWRLTVKGGRAVQVRPYITWPEEA